MKVVISDMSFEMEDGQTDCAGRYTAFLNAAVEIERARATKFTPITPPVPTPPPFYFDPRIICSLESQAGEVKPQECDCGMIGENPAAHLADCPKAKEVKP